MCRTTTLANSCHVASLATSPCASSAVITALANAVRSACPTPRRPPGPVGTTPCSITLLLLRHALPPPAAPRPARAPPSTPPARQHPGPARPAATPRQRGAARCGTPHTPPAPTPRRPPYLYPPYTRPRTRCSSSTARSTCDTCRSVNTHVANSP